MRMKINLADLKMAPRFSEQQVAEEEKECLVNPDLIKVKVVVVSGFRRVIALRELGATEVEVEVVL